ncbi:Essential protein Yae1 N-terminal [Penicillium paradoxum]|uniref:Essential protein Yae1 N-terminal n=1 Tax=Penicillium paradoxum TaxID=176176 RepID=UPI0025499C5D|nr:Essential protein Yae1 N-terminal [Penicillium paradoxum]KAJ5780409.1 Essential protein Yae1 N-terminal [Penicillium paradoxum]
MSLTPTGSDSAQSAPASPETTMTSTQTDDPAVDNSLDDIFGSSPPRSERELDTARAAAASASTSAEPSDLPSLRRQHVTAGYRDGTASSKGAHVQEGFDAGFPVGAQMGMRAGTVLGIMEGLLRGFEERSGPGAVKKPVRGNPATSGSGDMGNTDEITELRRQKREQLRTLYETALNELDVQAVFAEGGGPAEVAAPGKAEEERAEVQLARRGDVILSKWERRVDVPKWEENMEALEMKKDESKGDEGTVERS